MLCFCGGGVLSIKASNFPIHQQRQQGFVVGFTGSRIFCLHYFSLASIDVPQSAPMIQYLERKHYREAYKIACLGVTEGDWRILAMEALEGMDLDVAKKAFIRVRDLRFLELIHSIEERKQRGETNTQVFLADVYSYQGKFQEAAQLYRKAGHEQRAIEMFTDLREFELVKEFLGSSSQLNAKELMTKQADWARTTNDPQAACDMYVTAGEYLKAVEIMGDNGWVDRLLGVVHDLDSTESEVMNKCALYLKRLGQHAYAVEVYEKLRDNPALVSLYVEMQQWDNAFELAEKHPEFKNDVYVPYATWLVENDRFDEAQEALSKAGRQTEAVRLLEQLAENAINESRFEDAGYYYWLLAKLCLDTGRKELQGTNEDGDPQGSSLVVEEQVEQFRHFLHLAEVYHVYHNVHRFVHQPFTAVLPETLHNMGRFLLHATLKHSPDGISKVSILYTLAKQSRQLGAYKLARHAFDKLQSLKVPSALQESVDLGSITIRSKPFHDKEDLLPMCYRCSTTNPLLNNAGNQCINCKQPFEFSFHSFEVLPIVEFVLEEGLTDEEALKMIKAEPQVKKPPTSVKESHHGGAQTLVLDDIPEDDEDDPFNLNFEPSGEFVPTTVGRQTLQAMHRTEVLVKRWGPPIGNQYYRSMMPDISLSVCGGCNKIFHSDDYELQVLSKGHCPFCRKTYESPPP